MQERKRVEAVARQDHSSTALASLSHTEFDTQLPEEETPSPSSRALYLAKRRSVVEGLSAQDLLLQHRRSLVGLPVADDLLPNRPAISDLEGVTLSKRHTFTKQEYDAARVASEFEKLTNYSIGFEEGATDVRDAEADDKPFSS
jgi:hypothetical protein